MKKTYEREKKREILEHLKNLVAEKYEKISYSHFNIGATKLTVAVGVNKENPREAWFGWSLCAPEDQFDRLEGRLRATRRLVTEDSRCLYISKSDFPLTDFRPHDLCYMVAEDLLIDMVDAGMVSSTSRVSFLKEND